MVSPSGATGRHTTQLRGVTEWVVRSFSGAGRRMRARRSVARGVSAALAWDTKTSRVGSGSYAAPLHARRSSPSKLIQIV